MTDMLIMFLLGAIIFGSLGYCIGRDIGKRREAEAALDALRGDRQ